MARPAQPWFYAAKNTWYVWDGDRKVSLGVRGEDNKAEAMKAWHRLMANGKPPAEADVPSVEEIVSAFLVDANDRLKPDTVRGYGFLLRPFARQHGKIKADRLTAALAETYARQAEWTNSTRHDFLSVVAIVFRWAERKGLLASNPIRHLTKPPMESRGDKAIITDADHAKLLNAAPGYFKPFLRLLYLTGARPGEVAAITAENFDATNAVVRLKEHKTARHGRARIIVLPPEAVTLLEGLKGKNPTGHLVRNRLGRPYTKDAVVRMMASLRRKTGVKGATAYGYRHSFATDALANGVPDAQVSALLGHSGTTMLHRHYSHLTARTQALKDALGKVR